MGLCIPWNFFASRPAGTSFRVLTCNMHYERGNRARLEELLAETNPNIIALQEWRMSAPLALLSDPGWHVDQTERLFLASRFPIHRPTVLGLDSNDPEGSLGRYELETPAGRVFLFSLHLASPRQGIDEAIRDNGKGTVTVSSNMALRWQQSENTARQAGQVFGPRLLVGDFNTPPQSAIFRYVWNDYTDSFSSAGWGWGYTFFGGRTMVRIDHILLSKGWSCTNCWVGSDVGSPHRPVIADLIWSGRGN